MSSYGYNGSCSSSAGSSPVNSVLSWREESRNSPTSTNRLPGINNMMYGMHSFQSANELQFYMEQVGGQGSIVNITDAARLPIRRTPPVSRAGNRGVIMPLALPGLGNDISVVPNGSPQASGSLSGGSSSSSSSELPPVAPGFERNTYVFMCEIHNRANPPTAGLLNLSGEPPSQRGNNVMYLGYCAICRNIMLETSRGRSLLP